MTRIPAAQRPGGVQSLPHTVSLRGIHKAFLRRPSANIDSVCRKCSPWFLLPESYQIKTAPLKRLILQNLAKSASLIHLYTLNPTPCLPASDKPSSLLNSLINTLSFRGGKRDGCGFCIVKPCHPFSAVHSGFRPCVYLSFLLHSLIALVRSIPMIMNGCACTTILHLWCTSYMPVIIRSRALFVQFLQLRTLYC